MKAVGRKDWQNTPGALVRAERGFLGWGNLHERHSGDFFKKVLPQGPFKWRIETDTLGVKIEVDTQRLRGLDRGEKLVRCDNAKCGDRLGP